MVQELDSPTHSKTFSTHLNTDALMMLGHSIGQIHTYSPLNGGSRHRRDACWKVNERMRTAKLINPNFSFTDFRMIMKQHRQDKDRNLDQQLELLAYRSEIIREGSQVKQIIAVPKIINGRLIMRTQTAYVVPPFERSQADLLNRNFLACPHSNKWCYDNCGVAMTLCKDNGLLDSTLPQPIPYPYPLKQSPTTPVTFSNRKQLTPVIRNSSFSYTPNFGSQRNIVQCVWCLSN